MLSLLERNGLFLAGTVLVGTMACLAYANMPGVKRATKLATRDMDIAADNRFTVALPRPKKPINLGHINWCRSAGEHDQALAWAEKGLAVFGDEAHRDLKALLVELYLEAE